MTKFDEILDIITHNKNKGSKNKPFKNEMANISESDDDIQLEVSGSTKAPLVAAADDQLDPDIIDMLYTKPRHKPNDGSGASSWDSDSTY